MVLICLFRFVFCLMTLKLFIKCHFTFVVSYEAIVSTLFFIDLTVEQRFREAFRDVVLRNMCPQFLTLFFLCPS